MSIDRVLLDDTTDPDELLEILKKWDDEESQRYQTLHAEWEKSVLFHLGKQWIEDRGNASDGFTILEEDEELCNVIESSIAECFLGLIHSNSHSYSFKKYMENPITMLL